MSLPCNIFGQSYKIKCVIRRAGYPQKQTFSQRSGRKQTDNMAEPVAQTYVADLSSRPNWVYWNDY